MSDTRPIKSFLNLVRVGYCRCNREILMPALIAEGKPEGTWKRCDVCEGHERDESFQIELDQAASRTNSSIEKEKFERDRRAENKKNNQPKKEVIRPKKEVEDYSGGFVMPDVRFKDRSTGDQ